MSREKNEKEGLKAVRLIQLLTPTWTHAATAMTE